MRINRFALLAGVLALGAAACGDDVEIVQPTPPEPPLPPAVTASMAPASASVLIGNNVVFAVNASGGVAGDAASWTCASSNTGIATVSVVGTGCQATGVTAGSVTVTATVTKSGETVNVGAQLTVTSDEEPPAPPGDPAFILISRIEDDSRDVAEEVGTLSGRVEVDVSVERGDQTLEVLSLLVDGAVVASQSFGTPAMAAPEDDPAAEQAVHSFTLGFNSAGFDDHGHPDYMNGEHTISAELQIAGGMMMDGMMGHETISSNIVTVEFDNEDGFVVTADLGHNSALDDQGRRWYGGPDNGHIVISALPVSYSGEEAGVVTIGLESCDAEEGDDDHDHGGEGVSVEFDCEGEDDGRSITVYAAGVAQTILNEDDLPEANIDMMGPGAPTFNPNPDGREYGWINAAVGITSTKGDDAWLMAGASDAGVGGDMTQVRYAEAPKDESGLEEALMASPSSSLPAESKKDAYCFVASAVDRLGNESSLPDADDGTCKMAGMASRDAMDLNDDGDMTDPGEEAVVATGYQALLEAAAAMGATDADAKALANAGLRAGVDLTAPEVEFLAASLKDEATEIGDGPLWGLHVADRVGEVHSDPLDVSIEVRDTKETTKFVKATKAAADTFAVMSEGLRHTVTILGAKSPAVREGYYTFSATAKDAAGNESASVSRLALHDGMAPTEPGLFLVPEGDGYNSTVVLSDNLSIKSYSTGVVLPTIGSVSDPELITDTGVVDPYNAASLTKSRTVQGMVDLPYKALQVGSNTKLSAINTFKVYVSDQSGASTSNSSMITVDIDDIDPVTFRSGGDGLTVATDPSGTVEDDKDDIEVTVTADMEDKVENLDAPFSTVALYATVTVDMVTQLRQVGIVSAGAAETELTNDGRDWVYETTLDADSFWAAVEDTVAKDGNYMGNIVAFGVAEDGLIVAEVSGSLTVENRD